MKTETPIRMTYDTYAYLRSLVEDQQVKLEKEFQIACNYIPIERPNRNKQTGRDKAYDVFLKSSAQLDRVKEELKAAAASTHKDNPNPKMREFWGIEE